jgi:non-ribosomal peptide synthase protein (TIGR01720 family)
MKAALYYTSGCDYLMICIHHLVVDGVSWRILIEDFVTGYAQYVTKKQIVLPRKTASYLAWSEALNEYSQHDEIANEIGYWLKINEQVEAGKIAFDFITDDKEINYDQQTMVFNEAATKALLYEVGKAYGTQINDILLSALGIAVNAWKGKKKVAVQLEGHGREEIHKPIDVNRTVGWFTSIYPIIIEVSEEVDTMIVETKEMLRHIPNRGIGYSIIKYLSEYGLSDIEPDICFNYLGHWDHELKESSDIIISGLPSGRSIAANNKLTTPISMNGIIKGRQLLVTVLYDTRRYSEASIAQFCEYYERALHRVIEFCILQKETVKTASDYYEDLTTDVLKDLINIF